MTESQNEQHPQSPGPDARTAPHTDWSQPPEPPPVPGPGGTGESPAATDGGAAGPADASPPADAGSGAAIPPVDAGNGAAAGPSADANPAADASAGPAAGAVEGGEAGPRAALPPEPSPQAPPGAASGEAGKVVEEGDDDDTDPDPWVSSGAAPSASAAPAAAPAAPAASVLEVRELDWDAIRAAVAHPPLGERAERIIAGMEQRLSGGGPLGLAFEESAAGPGDRAIQIGEEWPLSEVWFIGDVHGDLLALEAALQHIDRSGGGPGARIVFLGDLFDDGRHAAQVVLRVFELLLNGPARITIVAGNHDEALAYADGRFQSTVLPSDFTDWLNRHVDDPLAVRLGHVIIQFFARAPRALFFPDGLLVAHGGIPHTDLHEELAKTGNWNDPRILQDFVWLRAHPRARKRIPNRTTRGSEFGRDDFTAFCGVATKLGRPIERMLRGHDHVEERFAVYPAWKANPVLTMNTLSHRLPREVFGPYPRVPVVGKWVRGELPEVRRLFVPPELIQEIYPEPVEQAPAQEEVA